MFLSLEHNHLAICSSVWGAEFVRLILESQLFLLLVASTFQLEPLASLACWLAFVTLDSSLLACHACTGSSSIDHGRTGCENYAGLLVQFRKERWFCDQNSEGNTGLSYKVPSHPPRHFVVGIEAQQRLGQSRKRHCVCKISRNSPKGGFYSVSYAMELNFVLVDRGE